jgi:predicted Rossmann-fold nucleotide-binding protein
MPDRRVKEISSPDEVAKAGRNLSMTAIKAVDLRSLSASYWREVAISSTYFFGCQFDSAESQVVLRNKGAIILQPFEGLPYQMFRYHLYTAEELLHRLPTGATVDETIYCDYLRKGRLSPDLVEALARRIHDDGIDDALEHLVRAIGLMKFVALMGGSSNKRTDPFYKKTALTARLLTQQGFFVVSGGGPGMMEAANLGAYFANYTGADLDQALAILAKAPVYTDPHWIATALEVKSRFPKGAESLGIPTWFYGVEPTNAFSSKIAKYFDNSIREGGLIQIGKAGIVFAPGSAGTRQEIFMDAAQNHYGTTGLYSPMVFLGKYQYQTDAPVYPLLQLLANSNFKDLLFITDEPSDIVDFLSSHKPVRVSPKKDRICGFFPEEWQQGTESPD